VKNRTRVQLSTLQRGECESLIPPTHPPVVEERCAGKSAPQILLPFLVMQVYEGYPPENWEVTTGVHLALEARKPAVASRRASRDAAANQECFPLKFCLITHVWYEL